MTCSRLTTAINRWQNTDKRLYLHPNQFKFRISAAKKRANNRKGKFSLAINKFSLILSFQGKGLMQTYWLYPRRLALSGPFVTEALHVQANTSADADSRPGWHDTGWGRQNRFACSLHRWFFSDQRLPKWCIDDNEQISVLFFFIFVQHQRNIFFVHHLCTSKYFVAT